MRLARRGPRRGIRIMRRIRAHGGRREARRGAYHGALPCLDPRMRRGGVGFETFVFEDAGAHAGGRKWSTRSVNHRSRPMGSYYVSLAVSS